MSLVKIQVCFFINFDCSLQKHFRKMKSNKQMGVVPPNQEVHIYFTVTAKSFILMILLKCHRLGISTHRYSSTQVNVKCGPDTGSHNPNSLSNYSNSVTFKFQKLLFEQSTFGTLVFIHVVLQSTTNVFYDLHYLSVCISIYLYI